MKHLAWIPALSIAAISLSASLAAQRPAQPARSEPARSAASEWPPFSAAPSGCPVSMHASQIGGGATVMVDQDGKRHAMAHGLHLSLTDPQHTATIVSAEVTVHGLNGKPHAVQSGQLFRFDPAATGNPWAVTRRLAVRFGAADDRTAETELSVAGFSAVTWIRLDSLTFSDGTVWIPPSGSACRTAPDPFMLVSAK